MPPKTRQATVENESPTSTSGETRGEVVPVTGTAAPSAGPSPSLVPGFSHEQVNSLMTLFSAMLDSKLEQRFGNFNENRQQSNPIPSIEYPDQQQEQPLYQSYEQPRAPALRAEEVGYFDPEYQNAATGPVVNAGKYVYYRDVYVFVDRLKDLATQHDVKHVISACFRGSALMWYSMELTDLERTGLRTADPSLWYTTLIDRFKTRTAVALSQLVGQTYSLQDIKHTSPRAFIQQMLHLAKSAEFHSTYNQLTLLWNQFAVNLRRDLPEPQPHTTVGQFLEQVDCKTPIWMELAQRQSQRPWQSRPLQDSTPNGQRNLPPQQQQQPYRGNNKNLPHHVTFENRKASAYLADVTPDGYGVYEEEGDEAGQER